MGPIAGLAAGLGIAALLSHFGLGEGFANFLMIALLAFAAVFLIRFVLRRMAAQRTPAARPGTGRRRGRPARGDARARRPGARADRRSPDVPPAGRERRP